jgi:ATP-dependent DNA helicase RecG
MTTTLDQLAEWMNTREGEHLEFKEAKNHFDFKELVRYCAALANEGGGHMILGVTDSIPRRVVGSRAFDNLERTKAGLVQRLHFRVEAEQLDHPDGPVIIFHVPGRPPGCPIHCEGPYWMRGGDSLVHMTPDQLKRIFNEAGPDFSAEICPDTELKDLEPAAIEEFRKRWVKHSKNASLARLPPEQLLSDAELLDERGVTFAALILLGSRRALGRFLAQAELVFEYRSMEAAGPANQRLEFREGFLLYYDKLWETVNLRNDQQHFQDGLFMVDVPTFSEGSVREAILNAVAHRDYRMAGSVFVRQYPRRIEIVSPGGFPAGITPENIIWRQSPRNRRIADAFEKCDLVERSGQGANRMFEEAVRQSKPLPDFTHTDAHQVSLTLHGEIQDPTFLRFLERVGQERIESFATEDLLVLDRIRREESVPAELRPRLPALVDQGIIEFVGRGRGTRYMLGRRYYHAAGRTGVYTRKRGLDRETNKALLLRHLLDNSEGSGLKELQQVLPALSADQVHRLLKELRAQELVRNVGATRASRWLPTELARQQDVAQKNRANWHP